MKKYLYIIVLIAFIGCKDDPENIVREEVRTPKFEKQEYVLSEYNDSETIRIFTHDSLSMLSYDNYYITKVISAVDGREVVSNITDNQDLSRHVISEDWYQIKRNIDGTLLVQLSKNTDLSEKILVVHVDAESEGSGYFTIIQLGANSVPQIIPEPSEVNVQRGFLLLEAIIPIQIDNAFGDISDCKDMLYEFMEENFKHDAQQGSVVFSIKNEPSLDVESYELSVNENGILLCASTEKGVLYGIQTFFQIFLSAVNNKIPYLTIKDRPRFSHRGLMLDPARHFIPISELRKFISIMPFYKFNRLHLHLSDDEGWCVEIKGLPKLTKPGAGSPNMGTKSRSMYTQEELIDLVVYAAARGIEIIPEIDIPSHSSYVVSAFPEMKCGILNTRGQVCAGNDKVLDFMNVVIAEFAAIFPSHDFHLGGDEFSIETMESCEICTSKMEELGYEDHVQLISYLFENVTEILEKHGKTPMFWHEPDIPYYPQNSTIYSWRRGRFADAMSASSGGKLISSPEEYAYFNFPQAWRGEPPFDNWGMPAISLKDVYSFDPTFGFSAEQVENLIGVEALLWNEYITSIDMLYYMIYPRALAFSDAAWSSPENRSWERFCEKLDVHLKYLSRKGINYRFPSEIYD